jgi:hypothetical protein
MTVSGRPPAQSGQRGSATHRDLQVAAIFQASIVGLRVKTGRRLDLSAFVIR